MLSFCLSIYFINRMTVRSISLTFEHLLPLKDWIIGLHSIHPGFTHHFNSKPSMHFHDLNSWEPSVFIHYFQEDHLFLQIHDLVASFSSFLFIDLDLLLLIHTLYVLDPQELFQISIITLEFCLGVRSLVHLILSFLAKVSFSLLWGDQIDLIIDLFLLLWVDACSLFLYSGSDFCLHIRLTTLLRL